jgi:PAS domain S-box-containing protein
MGRADESEREIQHLRRRLRESEDTVRALVSGEVDAVVDQSEGSPTMLRAAQQALHAQEKLFRAVFDSSLDAMFIADDEGYYVDANPAACGLFGVEHGELSGRGIGDFVENSRDLAGTWPQFLHSGSMQGEFLLRRADGDLRVVEFNATAHILPGRHLSVLRDITDRRRAERARAQAEEKLRRLLSNAPVVIFATDEDGRLTLVEGRALERAGLQAEQLVNRPIRRVLADVEIERVGGEQLALPKAIDRVFEGTAVHGVVSVRGMYFDARLSPLREGGRVVGALGIATDVSDQWHAEHEHRRAEQALRKTTGMLDALVEASPAGIVALDCDGEVTLCNRAAEHLFGADGADAGAVVQLAEQERGRLLDGIQEGRSVAGGSLPLLRQGEPARQLSFWREPLFDDAGRVSGAVVVLIDMSEQHRLEQQLRQAQKMEAVGRLAGGIAHDFNNMLSAIQGFASVVDTDLPSNDPLREDVEQILKATDRASMLTRQLLAFSRKQVLQPQAIDVNEQLDSMQQMWRRVIREDVELDFRGGEGVPCVLADLGQLEQVLTNLVVNARDSMPKGGTLQIETERREVGEQDVDPHCELRAGIYAVIHITDSGSGMSERVQAHIFEPFFTTKGQGEGTGLGLSTVYGIVKQSGGHIAVNSIQGEGTTFSIYLPQAPARSQPPDRLQPPTTQMGGDERILVVEDEELVRRLASQVLRRHGYRVLEASGSEEALEQLQSEGCTVDLLLTDMVMPGQPGSTLADQVAERHPHIRVLYMSGYSEDPDLVGPETPLVQKPFSPEGLLQAVRTMLDQ